MAVAFPYLATDRIKRLRWGVSWRLDKTQSALQNLPPMVCVAKQKGAMRLASLDISAQSHRLREGQGVTEARAICPDLDIIPSDDAADLAFLNALADWADRYTPLIGIDAPFGKPQGLFLDITGCAHLFGGEAEMLKDIISRFDKMGIYATGSIAPTPGLAWGLARQHEPCDYVSENVIMNWDNLDARFRQFPMAALRLPLDMLLALDRVGLKKVKDIMSAPRKPLMRRFGPLLLKRLDQALGREEEPVSPRLPVSDLSVERRLAEPIGRQEDIETCIEQLSNSLRCDLEKRGQAGQEFMLLLFRMDGVVRQIMIGLSAPSRDAKRIKALFSQKLAAIYDESDAGTGFETIRLCVVQAVVKSDVQESFVNGSNVQTNMHQLADQITARLGKDSVVKPAFHQSFIPELAASFVPVIEHKQYDETILQNDYYERPIRLFSNPEPVTAIAEVPEGPPIRFKWRRSQYQVARAEGPERIAAEWWIDGESAQTRDYYRVEDKSGRRFWIFRQGLYERETHLSDGLLPKWFMHGLFA
ncbi:MAG: DNA polymerase Y family protein [Lentilitoribacter sp.]